MGLGAQIFGLWRDGKTIVQETSPRNVTEVCDCGNYNFNAYVGRVPLARGNDQLAPAGAAMLKSGIRVPTEQCVVAAAAGAETDDEGVGNGAVSESESTSESASTSTSQKRSWGFPGRWEWLRGWRDYVDLE